MLISKNICKAICGGLLFSLAYSPSVSFADSFEDQIRANQQQQQQLLDAYNAKKREQEVQAQQINTEVNQLKADLAAVKNMNKYDAEGAITSISNQIALMGDAIQALTDKLNKTVEWMNSMQASVEKLYNERPAVQETAPAPQTARQLTSGRLVNPAPYQAPAEEEYTAPQPRSYVQEASNSQSSSTQIFNYNPNAVYKIYCRNGYLTDLQFQPGEAITFVGGGDTSAWAIDSANVAGTPHLYIKPINAESVTNIIVNTTKHVYHLIVTASDWYNPMVMWSYGFENDVNTKFMQQKEEKLVTGTVNVTSAEQLNFNYSIKGDASWKPIMVFDDGSKTFIKFRNMSNSLPILFIKERGRRDLQLVNYRVKDDCYIVDKIFDQAELKVNDYDCVVIKRNKPDYGY